MPSLLAANLASRIAQRDRRALSQSLTALENNESLGRQVLDLVSANSSASRIVGFTGPPGAGKSTLVNQVITQCRRRHQSVAVLAVDPSSHISSGALLGDRIRMTTHWSDDDVFIRSMASRGRAGGLAPATAESALLLASAGFDYVLIETVGVGQAEIAVTSLVDVTVVVLAPAAGDDIQADKAGLLEAASLFVVNKADLPGAAKLAGELRTFQTFSDTPTHIPVCQVNSLDGSGVSEVLQAVENLYRERRESGLTRTPEANLRKLALAVNPILDHVAIAVRRIEDSLPLFQDLLGFRGVQRETVGSEQVHTAMLPAGDRSFSNTRIELLEASQPESTVGRFIETHGPGLHHLALRVSDLASLSRTLREAGIQVLHPPRRGAGGHWYTFIHPRSTGGLLLELVEPESSYTEELSS